jgi:hypothetical protein
MPRGDFPPPDGLTPTSVTPEATGWNNQAAGEPGPLKVVPVCRWLSLPQAEQRAKRPGASSSLLGYRTEVHLWPRTLQMVIRVTSLRASTTALLPASQPAGPPVVIPGHPLLKRLPQAAHSLMANCRSWSNFLTQACRPTRHFSGFVVASFRASMAAPTCAPVGTSSTHLPRHSPPHPRQCQRAD